MKVSLELPERTYALSVTMLYDDPHVIEPVCVNVKAMNVEDGRTYDVRPRKNAEVSE